MYNNVLSKDVINRLRELTQTGLMQWQYHDSEVCSGAWDSTYGGTDYTLIKRPLGPWEVQIDCMTHYLFPKLWGILGLWPWCPEAKLIRAIKASARKVSTGYDDYQKTLMRNLNP